jgi:hypothetical protein
MKVLKLLILLALLGCPSLVAQVPSLDRATHSSFQQAIEWDILHGIEALRVEVFMMNDIPELTKGRIRADVERSLRSVLRIDPGQTTVLGIEIAAEKLDNPGYPVGYALYLQAKLWQPVYIAKEGSIPDETGVLLPGAVTWRTDVMIGFLPLGGFTQSVRGRVQRLADVFLEAYLRTNP